VLSYRLFFFVLFYMWHTGIVGNIFQRWMLCGGNGGNGGDGSLDGAACDMAMLLVMWWSSC